MSETWRADTCWWQTPCRLHVSAHGLGWEFDVFLRRGHVPGAWDTQASSHSKGKVARGSRREAWMGDAGTLLSCGLLSVTHDEGIIGIKVIGLSKRPTQNI